MLREKFVEDREAYKQKYIDELEKNILLTGMTFEELVYKKITKRIENDNEIIFEDIFFKPGHWVEVIEEEYYDKIKGYENNRYERIIEDAEDSRIFTVKVYYRTYYTDNIARAEQKFFTVKPSRKILFWNTKPVTNLLETKYEKYIGNSYLEFNKYTVDYAAEKIRELGFWVKTEGNNIIVYWNEPQNEVTVIE